MGELLTVRHDPGGVAIVTVDRPAQRNALSRAAWLELQAVVRAARSDDATTGMIVTGAGTQAFAAGADVGELVDRDPLVALDGLVQGILSELEDLPIPTVAAINGHALGGGWELALACDLRVAVAGARVGFPEVKLGIMPGAGGTQRLLQHVGIGRAKELILAARLLDADEALGLGLVNRIAPDDDVLGASRALLDEVLAGGRLAVRLAKEVLNVSARGGDTSDLERLAYTLTFFGEERTERMRRFLDERHER